MLTAVSHIVFSTGHVVFQGGKGNFRLDHPEFRQMTGSVGVFRPESWAESVNIRQATSIVLTIELTRDGQVGQ